MDDLRFFANMLNRDTLSSREQYSGPGYPQWFIDKVNRQVTERNELGGADGFFEGLRRMSEAPIDRRLNLSRALRQKVLGYLYPERSIEILLTVARRTMEMIESSEGMFDLRSNDPASMARHPHVVTRRMQADFLRGQAGDRSEVFLSENTGYEAGLCNFARADGLIMTATGTLANYLVTACLLEHFKKDNPIIITDPRIHTSIQDPIRKLGLKRGVNVFSPDEENDLNAMIQLIERLSCGESFQSRPKFLYLESVFSVDGQVLGHGKIKLINQLLDLAHTYGFIVVMDDAHSYFIDGPGHSVSWGVQDKIHFRTTSGSKGPGRTEADIFINGDSADVVRMNQEWLKMQPTHTFTSAMDPTLMASHEAAMEVSSLTGFEASKIALRNTQYLKRKLQGYGFNIKNDEGSVIIFITTGSTELAFKFNDILKEMGVFTSAFIYPATPIHEGGVRLSIGSHLNDVELDYIADSILKASLGLLNQLLAQDGNTVKGLRESEKIVSISGKLTDNCHPRDPSHRYLSDDLLEVYEKNKDRLTEDVRGGYPMYLLRRFLSESGYERYAPVVFNTVSGVRRTLPGLPSELLKILAVLGLEQVTHIPARFR